MWMFPFVFITTGAATSFLTHDITSFLMMGLHDTAEGSIAELFLQFVSVHRVTT